MDTREEEINNRSQKNPEIKKTLHDINVNDYENDPEVRNFYKERLKRLIGEEQFNALDDKQVENYIDETLKSLRIKYTGGKKKTKKAKKSLKKKKRTQKKKKTKKGKK